MELNSALILQKRWSSEKAKGAALLSRLEQQLIQLHTSPVHRPHDIVRQIASKVSAPRLTAYARDSGSKLSSGESQMQSISTCMGALLEHQQTLHDIATSYKGVADSAYREASELSPGSSRSSLLTDEFGLASATPDSPMSTQGGTEDALSSSRVCKESLEAALRMVTISEALQQELELTDRVVQNVALDMSLEELSTYQLMWQLSPFMHPELMR